MNAGLAIIGSIIGLSLLGILAPAAASMYMGDAAQPMAMNHDQHDYRHMDGEAYGHYNHETMMHEYMYQQTAQRGTCTGECTSEPDHVYTTITGTIVSVDPEGYIVVDNGTAQSTINIRGIWTDGQTRITYTTLLSNLTNGDNVVVIGFEKCTDRTIKATSITINNTTYTLTTGH